MIRDGTVEEVIQLCQAIPEFKNSYPKEEFIRRLSLKNSMILVAEEEGIPVGFKCGYESEELNTYYSWMGGVIPAYRNMQIAKTLLLEMERRIKTMGYKFLSFKTLNEHKAMLIFAFKNGFEIVNVVESAKDSKPRIWLKKQLD